MLFDLWFSYSRCPSSPSHTQSQYNKDLIGHDHHTEHGGSQARNKQKRRKDFSIQVLMPAAVLGKHSLLPTKTLFFLFTERWFDFDVRYPTVDCIPALPCRQLCACNYGRTRRKQKCSMGLPGRLQQGHSLWPPANTQTWQLEFRHQPRLRGDRAMWIKVKDDGLGPLRVLNCCFHDSGTWERSFHHLSLLNYYYCSKQLKLIPPMAKAKLKHEQNPAPFSSFQTTL